jgi:cyclin A
VCRELEFRLSCITPFHFVNLFLRASNGCPNGGCEFDHPVLRQVVMYLLVFSRLSYQLSLSKPSLLAAAAVYLARATVGIRESDPAHAVHPEGFWTRTLEYYTGYKLGDLRDSVLIIHRYQLGAEKAENMKGIFSKFSKSSHHYASLKTAVRACFR